MTIFLILAGMFMWFYSLGTVGVPRSQNSETWKSPKLESLNQVFYLSLRGAAGAEELRLKTWFRLESWGAFQVSEFWDLGTFITTSKIIFIMQWFDEILIKLWFQEVETDQSPPSGNWFWLKIGEIGHYSIVSWNLLGKLCRRISQSFLPLITWREKIPSNCYCFI